jgi:hypothetical protein
MLNRYRTSTTSTLALATFAVLAIMTPGAAQVGGIRSKIKPPAGKAAGTPPEQGGTVVLTADVVSQLLKGLKAGQAERALAAKEDTPYGRFKTAETAFAVAQPKCEAAKESFPQRGAANPKLADKQAALTQKMVAAMEKHDQRMVTIYNDSAMAIIDPSCIVKKPELPRDLYDAEREVEVRAEQKEVKASGLTAGEYAMSKEKTYAVLGADPASDISASERAAVSARAAELRPLLGFQEPAPAAQATASVSDTAPTAPAPEASPQISAEMNARAQDMSACMTKNMQAHQAEIEALAKRAQAAQKAKDMAKTMAIADTIQQLQMAGCMGGR